MKDNEVTYESIKSFLTRSIDVNAIPKGLVFQLEKHDQDFLCNWCSKLKPFSISMMDDIGKFWKTIDKTIRKNTAAITNWKKNVKMMSHKE